MICDLYINARFQFLKKDYKNKILSFYQIFYHFIKKFYKNLLNPRTENLLMNYTKTS